MNILFIFDGNCESFFILTMTFGFNNFLNVAFIFHFCRCKFESQFTFCHLLIIFFLLINFITYLLYFIFYFLTYKLFLILFCFYFRFSFWLEFFIILLKDSLLGVLLLTFYFYIFHLALKDEKKISKTF
jgi:hypothetical protein